MQVTVIILGSEEDGKNTPMRDVSMAVITGKVPEADIQRYIVQEWDLSPEEVLRLWNMGAVDWHYQTVVAEAK